MRGLLIELTTQLANRQCGSQRKRPRRGDIEIWTIGAERTPNSFAIQVQSIDEQIDRLINDKFLSLYLIASAFWLVAFLEWTAKIFNRPRVPGTYAIAAALCTAAAVYQFLRIRRDVRNLKQGREGEREVAELLDDLKQYGARVGRYLGEGFDDARLDTLFLVMPNSWKGTLAQYVGRLHRDHDGKRKVVVYDYVDRAVPVLARMAAKYEKGYKALGYVLES